MQFQTEISKQEAKQNYFLSQVHQPFFILSILNSVVSMLIFALAYKGFINLHVGFLNFHVYSLVFLVFLNAFSGFLYTTFPRFTQAPIIEKSYYTKLFYANTLGSFVFFVGAFLSYMWLVIGMMILFVSHVYIVLKLKQSFEVGLVKDIDAFWILRAMYAGLFSHVLFVALIFGLDIQNITLSTSFYMFVIFLTLGVAQRMIPFFSHSNATKDERFMSAVFVLFIAKTILYAFENNVYVNVAQILLDALLGLYLVGEFLRWKLPLFKSSAILWVLYLGLFFLPLGFFISAFSAILELIFNINFYYLDIHIIAIGFLTTILIGFGTRVILGHSNQPTKADGIAVKIFYLVELVLLFRVLYSLDIAFGFGLDYLFDMSFIAWISLFVVWALRYAKVLLFGVKG